MNQKNIKIFYALAFLQGLVFYSSVATLYRTANGISLLEMGIIESCFSVFMIVLEIPWGRICDRIGYKKTMFIANGAYFLSKVVFWRASGFGAFLLERFLLAVAVSGLSGCDSSLLYLSAEPEKAADIYGKQSMFGVMGMVTASLGFTFFLKENMRGAAFATMIAYLLAFVLTIFLEDIEEQNKKRYSLGSSIKAFLKNKSMVIVLLASALLTETTHTITIFYNQLQYERVGIPVAYYGVMFMGMQFVSMSCGLLGKVTERISKERLAYILFGIAGFSILGLIFSEDAISTILFLMILTCIECMYYPILTAMEVEKTDIGARATMMSIYSLVMNFFAVFINAGFGKAADVSLTSAYVLGIVFCVVGVVLFVKWLF